MCLRYYIRSPSRCSLQVGHVDTTGCVRSFSSPSCVYVVQNVCFSLEGHAMYGLTHTFKWAHVYTYTQAHTQRCMHAYTHAQHTHAPICTHTHTCTTYTHAHIQHRNKYIWLLLMSLQKVAHNLAVDLHINQWSTPPHTMHTHTTHTSSSGQTPTCTSALAAQCLFTTASIENVPNILFTIQWSTSKAEGMGSLPILGKSTLFLDNYSLGIVSLTTSCCSQKRLCGSPGVQ